MNLRLGPGERCGTMRWRDVVPLALALALAPIPRLGALDVALSQEDIERALAVARGSEAERARFHRRYVFSANDATVTQLEVITEFRRFVITAEDRLQHGDWMFTRGTRAAERALAPQRGRMTIAARLRFNPLNTYISVPAFEISLGVPSLDTRTTEQYASPMPGQRNATTPPAGALLETDFASASIGQMARPVSVLLNGKELTRVTVDFAHIE